MRSPIRLLMSVFVVLVGLGGAASCDNAFEGSLPRRDQLNYPIGLTIHPNGRFAYVVNSNFDGRYRPDAGGTISVIDTETLQIKPMSTPFVPSFGAQIELNDAATKAYVTARNGDAVVAYDVAADGSALYCDDDGVHTSDPAACIIDQVDADGDARPAELPSDPFGLAVYTVERAGQPVDVVNVSSLQSSRVSSISLPGPDVSAATLRTAPILSGGNAVAQRPHTLNLYVAGRQTNGVAVFQPFINDAGQVEAIIQRGSFALSNRVVDNQPIQVDARALAFNDAGERLYVVSRRPDALYTVAISDDDAGLSRRVVSSTPLPEQPGDIALHTTPSGRQLAYITNYDDRSITVVDVGDHTIVDQISLDASPYAIAIEPTAAGCNTPTARCRAFVTLFNDTRQSSSSCNDAQTGCGSVAVIDINPTHRNRADPGVSRYHRVISKIH